LTVKRYSAIIDQPKRFGYDMTVTIRDVARYLKLSITTVSRALDGYADVSEATRQRVVEAARELGYTPNRAARQLRRQRSETIGYILPASTPRFSDPFFSEFISGLGDEVTEHGYDLLISTAHAGQDSELQLYQRWTHSHKVDGYVLNRLWQSDWRVGYLSSQKIPFVALERSQDSVHYPSIQVESKDSLARLVKYLVDRGYCRIAFIGGPSNLVIQAKRLDGYYQGLKENQMPFDPTLVTSADLTSTGGYQAAKQLLKITDPPDAIMCINDETAFGVLHAAREAGRIVGESLAVTGFDDLQDSKHSQPTLTTLDQPLYEIARQLVRMLIDEITGQTLGERQVIIQPILQIRESTGKTATQ
jgi:LacI family transcriptional regulator, galactose operon repressor